MWCVFAYSITVLVVKLIYQGPSWRSVDYRVYISESMCVKRGQSYLNIYKLGGSVKHMIWRPLMIKCTTMMWLTCFILWSMLAWEHQCENTTWNNITSSLLGVAWFSWSILLIASTKHLKCFLDHHFHISLLSTTLGLPTHRRRAPTQGRSDLSPKNYSWYSLKITWLIDPSDGLNLMSNFESFFKSFSFYLFKSFSFY
jgi:hypothetical protein